jgi:hypothetical protein
MLAKSLLTLCCVLGLLFSLPAQDLNECRLDYAPFQQQTQTRSSELFRDAHLTLHPSYLQALANGEFAQVSSSLYYYRFVRYATREEQAGEMPLPVRQVMKEGKNIYEEQPVPGDVHFFVVPLDYKGDLQPQVHGDRQVIPPALQPVQLGLFQDREWRLLAITSSLLLLEVANQRVVFYRFYPPAESVFESEAARNRRQQLEDLSTAWQGKEVQWLGEKKPLFRAGVHGVEVLPQQSRGLTYTVQDVIIRPHEVLLKLDEFSDTYLVINQHTQAALFDPNCLAEVNYQFRQQNHEAAAALDRRINQFLTDTLSLSTAFRQSWLVETLVPRFQAALPAVAGQEGRYNYFDADAVLSEHRPGLGAWVENDGSLVLRSQYVSPRGLYHTQVEIWIGDNKWTSHRLPTMDPRNQRQRQGGMVREQLLFDLHSDGGTTEAIARHAGQPIVLRFIAGGSFYEEQVLSPREKALIRDCWLFSQWLKERK